MICDGWLEVNILSKVKVPSCYGLRVKVFKVYFRKRVTHSVNQMNQEENRISCTDIGSKAVRIKEFLTM